MSNSTALERLTRRLNLIGTALLAGAAVAFVWAVGFTRGVDGLIEGLVIAAVGLFIPGAAALWVAWIIGTSGVDDAFVEPQAQATVRERLLTRLRDYTIAALCVAVAAGARTLLTPYLGHLAPFPTFFLAVTVAAWLGGMGPAVFAAALSVPVVWQLFLEVPPPQPGPTGELVAAGLFIAVALAIGGITAALRLTQSRAEALNKQIAASGAALDESEARFRDLADRAPVLIRLTGAAREATYFNDAWYAYTGRTPEQERGDGWLDNIHFDDRTRYGSRFVKACDAREAYTLEYRLRRHDGVFERHREHGVPRFQHDGRFVGYIAEVASLSDLAPSPRGPTHAAQDLPPEARGAVQ